jgi:O-antigen ligase
MRSLVPERTVSSLSSPGFQVVIQVLIAFGCGLVLVWISGHSLVTLTIAALVAVAFILVFLQRPDLGLLAVLVIRSFSDKFVRGEGVRGAALGSRLTGSPNVGLILTLVFGGTLYVLVRRLQFLRNPGAMPLLFLLLIGTIRLLLWGYTPFPGAFSDALRPQALFAGIDRWLAVWSALVVYALAAALFREPKRMQRVIDVMAVAFIPPAVYGIYEQVTGNTMYEELEKIYRVGGTFSHPNSFSFFLVLMFGVFLCQAVTQKGWRRLAGWSIVLTAGALLSLTLTRSAFAGVLIIVLIVGMLRQRALLFLLPVAVVVALALVPSIGARMAAPLDPTSGSFADRLGIWESAYNSWLSLTVDDQSSVATLMNRLVGMGPASFILFSGVVAHNDYLSVFFEYGILGLIAFLGMSAALIGMALRAWRQTTDPVMAPVALGFFAVAVAFQMIYFFDNLFANTANQLYFWTLAGLTAAIGQVTVRAEEPASPPLLGAERWAHN